MSEILLNNADWDYFKILTSQEILTTLEQDAEVLEELGPGAPAVSGSHQCSITIRPSNGAEAPQMECPPKSMRMNGRKTLQSSAPTDASMPMRLSGTERVGHHGLSLPPSFPRTGGIRSNVLQFQEQPPRGDTCQHGGAPNTSVSCPPEPSCTQHRPSWPLLAALSRPTQGRTEGRWPPPVGHRRTKGDLLRGPLWPCDRSRTQQSPCRGVSRCTVPWPRLHGTLSLQDNGSEEPRLNSKLWLRKDTRTKRLSEGPDPECARKWACTAAHDWFNTTFFLKWCSEDDEAQYCQPCGHSQVLNGCLPPVGFPP